MIKITKFLYTKKDQDHIPCSFGYNTVCIDDKFRPVVYYEGENVIHKFINAILEGYDYYKKVMNERFDKNTVMSVENESRFQSNNKCWICNKLCNDEDKKSKRS